MSDNVAKQIIGNVTLYGCGGAGITIAHQFEKFSGQPPVEGFAAIKPVYIDTSNANLNSLDGGYRPEAAYVFDKIDGSGKIRRENASQITKHALDILVTHRPGDLNIVVSSASGGSGSVIAPSLVSELLSQGHNVIVLCVGSSDSIIEINNTVNTLKSYESIASIRSHPVVMIFEENARGIKLDDVNKKLYGDIVQLSALFSRQNIGLDSADLKNWLDYSRHSATQPKLAVLKFAEGTIFSEDDCDPISIASLARKGYDTSPGIVVDYRCYGVIRDTVTNIDIKEALHYVICDGMVGPIFQIFDDKKSELDLRQRSRPIAASIVAIDDRIEDNGLVL